MLEGVGEFDYQNNGVLQFVYTDTRTYIDCTSYLEQVNHSLRGILSDTKCDEFWICNLPLGVTYSSVETDVFSLIGFRITHSDVILYLSDTPFLSYLLTLLKGFFYGRNTYPRQIVLGYIFDACFLENLYEFCQGS